MKKTLASIALAISIATYSNLADATCRYVTKSGTVIESENIEYHLGNDHFSCKSKPKPAREIENKTYNCNLPAHSDFYLKEKDGLFWNQDNIPGEEMAVDWATEEYCRRK